MDQDVQMFNLHELRQKAEMLREKRKEEFEALWNRAKRKVKEMRV